MFGDLKKWKPVREVLDFEDEGESIFGRKKQLVEATLERIYAGLIKFVARGKEAFIVKYNSVNKKTGKYVPPSIDEPCPTVTVQNRLGVAKVSFLSKQFSGEPYSKNKSIEEPAGTITTIDHHAFISAYYGNGNNHSCDEPSATLTTKDRFALVQPNFINIQYGNGTPISVEEPGEAAIEVYDTDTPAILKIKEFMALYGIIDVKMRMLKIPELKKIMGFPEEYVLVGTQAEQKKYIGNAVEVTVARCWCEALCAELNKHFKKANNGRNAKALEVEIDGEIDRVNNILDNRIKREKDGL